MCLEKTLLIKFNVRGTVRKRERLLSCEKWDLFAVRIRNQDPQSGSWSAIRIRKPEPRCASDIRIVRFRNQNHQSGSGSAIRIRIINPHPKSACAYTVRIWNPHAYQYQYKSASATKKIQIHFKNRNSFYISAWYIVECVEILCISIKIKFLETRDPQY